MKEAFLNWLQKPIGAALSPIFIALIGASVGWVKSHFPSLAPYITPELLTTVIFGLGMVWVNWATTNRSFKYGGMIQGIFNIIGRNYGIQINQDGVPAKVTVANAQVIAAAVTQGDAPVSANPNVTPSNPSGHQKL